MFSKQEEAYEMNEAWDQVGKSVNEATELYYKELEAYTAWAQNVRREIIDQTFAMSRQLSRMGEAQLAFFARMPRNLPLFGMVPPRVSIEIPEPVERQRPWRAT